MWSSSSRRLTSGVGLVSSLIFNGASAAAEVPQTEVGSLYEPQAAVTCEDEQVAAVHTVALVPIGSSDLRPTDDPVRHQIDFSIGRDGRPRDIASSEAAGSRLGAGAMERNEAVFAAWRFPSNDGRSGCRLAVTYRALDVADASPPLLAAYYGDNRIIGPLRDAVERELAGDGANCEERVEARSRTTPDFNAPGKRPGVQDWSVVRWSITAAGRVQDVEILASSGSQPFDAEVVRATEAAELVPGPAQVGCIYNWYRRGLTIPAPEMPEPPLGEDRRCPASVLASWRPSPSPGPGAFRERGVEGWALVRFDIAPWGEVGNVELIEAQPAKVFGDAAVLMVQRGRAGRGEGGVGCIQPVEFRIPG